MKRNVVSLEAMYTFNRNCLATSKHGIRHLSVVTSIFYLKVISAITQTFLAITQTFLAITQTFLL